MTSSEAAADLYRRRYSIWYIQRYLNESSAWVRGALRDHGVTLREGDRIGQEEARPHGKPRGRL